MNFRVFFIVLELLLRAAFEAKFGTTKSPDVAMFAQFKVRWTTIDQKEYKPGNKSKLFKVHLADCAEGLITFCTEQLKRNFRRVDYKELLELCIMFLGGSSHTAFQYPGAIHHARWLSKAIYCLKLYLFRRQHKLPKSDEKSLEVLCIFIVKIYVKVWMLAENAIQAPNNDLKLVRDIHGFRKVDSIISKAALNKIQGHLWYLADECIALSFFDENVSLQCKRKMVKSISTRSTDTAKCKRLIVDSKEMELFAGFELHRFVTGHSLDFFKRFKINTDFLEIDPSEWKSNSNFMKALKVIENLTVVNDCAERGVKLISDFSKVLTSDENQKQALLQVVCNERQSFPKHSKESLLTKNRIK